MLWWIATKCQYGVVEVIIVRRQELQERAKRIFLNNNISRSKYNPRICSRYRSAAQKTVAKYAVGAGI